MAPTSRFIVIAVFTLVAVIAHAQVTIGPTLPYTYQQNFDSLKSSGTITWDDGKTLHGWYIASEGSWSGNYLCSAGITGGVYSFGNTVDRALGSINSGTLGNIAFGVLFQNQTTQSINSAALTYTCEQWTKQSSNSRGYHRLLVSYLVAPVVSTLDGDIMNNSGFIEIPELFGFTPDTTYITTGTTMNGNETRVDISVNFPNAVPPGQQVFIRFYDENENWTDHGMGIDDLILTFSNQQLTMTTASQTLIRPVGSTIPLQTIYPYIEQGIIRDIPATGNYIEPNSANLAAWTTIFDNFYNRQWTSVDAANFGYSLVHFTDGTTGKQFYLLRKNDDSGNWWGTFVQSLTPGNGVLVLQAPHPIDDTMTEHQAAAVFQMNDASDLMIAGISRCANTTHSSCSGTTNICGIQNELYRISDNAHNTSSLMHLATQRLSAIHTNRIFVQLHGFGSTPPADPYFIASCGSDNGKTKGIPDYGVLIREQLLAMDPTWTVKIAHVDDFDRLGGTNNVQGRFLNLYPYDICTGTTKPLTATNRFFHLEQHIQFRRWCSYYDEVAAAINNVINGNTYTRQLLINSLPLTYTQDFNNLSSAAGAHTWGNHVHLPGWHVVQAQAGLFSNYNSDAGTSATGGLYSYGNSSDRALGTLNDASTGDIAFGVLFKNNTSDMINRATFSFKGEQWRKAVSGTAQHKVRMSYTVKPTIDVSEMNLMNNSQFTSVPAGDLVTLDNNTSTGGVDGNTTFSSVTNLTIPLPVPPGSEVFIRFFDENISGANKAIALDDFSVTFDSQPLPVTWRSFEVTQRNKTAHVSWTTTNERACATYRIERSPDGIKFETVGVVPCANKKTLNVYHYSDENPPVPQGYYRIKQFDDDDMFITSPLRFFRFDSNDFVSIRREGNDLVVEVSPDDFITRIDIINVLGASSTTLASQATADRSNSMKIDYNGSGPIVIRVWCRRTVLIRKMLITD